MTTTRETNAEKRQRPMVPGELRGYRVPGTSVEVAIQMAEVGSFLVFVQRSGVLDSDCESRWDREDAARLIARMHIAAAVAAREGTTAGLDGVPRSPLALAPWPTPRTGC